VGAVREQIFDAHWPGNDPLRARMPNKTFNDLSVRRDTL
jgi:hypothetical protein